MSQRSRIVDAIRAHCSGLMSDAETANKSASSIRSLLCIVTDSDQRRQFSGNPTSALSSAIDEVRTAHGPITRGELLGKKRHRPLSAARAHLVRILRDEHKLSFETIGNLLGKRHHTTVMYLYDSEEKKAAKNERYRERKAGREGEVSEAKGRDRGAQGGEPSQ